METEQKEKIVLCRNSRNSHQTNSNVIECRNGNLNLTEAEVMGPCDLHLTYLSIDFVYGLKLFVKYM